MNSKIFEKMDENLYQSWNKKEQRTPSPLHTYSHANMHTYTNSSTYKVKLVQELMFGQEHKKTIHGMGEHICLHLW